jgi:xanthine dehydrogenase YagT iron-sulfur-binding subunit
MKSDKRVRVSRRGFFGSVAAGAAGTAVLAGGEARARAAAEPEESRLLPIVLHVNGREHRLEVEARSSLLYALRDQLGLTGTKPGCERGECGACTVLIDGVARYSCLTLAVEAAGARITTIEGVMKGEQLGPVQQAFVEEDAFQCGYCTPGQVMAVEALLRRNPKPSEEEIREGVSGTLCRCGSYAHIFKAARRAAELKQKATS